MPYTLRTRFPDESAAALPCVAAAVLETVGGPRATATAARDGDVAGALCALAEGNARMRLPSDWDGVDGRIAMAFNQLAARMYAQAERIRALEAANRTLMDEVFERRCAEEELRDAIDLLRRQARHVAADGVALHR